MSATAAREAIDERHLENDLGYRFAYLARFIAFGPETVEAIHTAGPLLAPLVPNLVDAVYDHLFAFDATKRHFVPRQYGYEGETPTDMESLAQDHAQIQFRKKHLGNYLKKLVTGAYDAKMVGYLDWVGKIHTPEAGSKELSVPLVQMNALLGFVSDALILVIGHGKTLRSDDSGSEPLRSLAVCGGGSHLC
jgi:hypothetical protein